MASEGKLLTLRSGSTDECRKGWETSARIKVIRQRRARAWTQEQLALWLGCSVDAVQLWETGKRRVPGWVLEALAFETSSFVTRESAVRPALSGLETAAEAFYLPKWLAKCHAQQSAPLRACTRFASEGASCVQGWATTPQGEASEGVARKAAA
jgi:DNA-binding XRE family transcriptional regulator